MTGVEKIAIGALSILIGVSSALAIYLIARIVKVIKNDIRDSIIREHYRKMKDSRNEKINQELFREVERKRRADSERERYLSRKPFR